MNFRYVSVALALTTAASASSPTSPYVADAARTIKALGADEIGALERGEGFGMARAAELNGYPGPRHALDLADELALDVAQRAALAEIFASMHERAMALGPPLVAAERDLDMAFASNAASDAQIDRVTATIARLRGELRATHLRAHVATARVLDAAQRRRYADLRGYAFADRDERR